MLIYDALVNDHNKVKDLLARLVALDATDEKERDWLIQEIHDELIPHARAEEAVLYNSIRAINTAQDLAWHGYEEHMAAEALLRSLQGAAKIDTGWKKIALKLKDALEHHIIEEEARVIPVARQLFTEEEAMVMGEAFEGMKPEVLEGGIVQNTLDMIANMMPPRLAAPLRTYTLRLTR